MGDGRYGGRASDKTGARDASPDKEDKEDAATRRQFEEMMGSKSTMASGSGKGRFGGRPSDKSGARDADSTPDDFSYGGYTVKHEGAKWCIYGDGKEGEAYSAAEAKEKIDKLKESKPSAAKKPLPGMRNFGKDADGKDADGAKDSPLDPSKQSFGMRGGANNANTRQGAEHKKKIAAVNASSGPVNRQRTMNEARKSGAGLRWNKRTGQYD